MRLHDRYFFRELITPLAFLTGGFVILGIGVFFTKELENIQDRKLSLPEAAGYCATSLPEFIVLVLPILLLLALLYALTRHARYNEITALRAAGVSLWRLCAPYFIVGLAATAAYFAANEFAVPACDRWSAEILNRHAKKDEAVKPKPQGAQNVFNGRDRRSWQFTDFDERTGVMMNPTVTSTLPDGSWRVVQADRAVYSGGVWTFLGVRRSVSQAGGRGEPMWGGTNSMLAVPEFTETPKKIETLLKYADTQTLHATGYADIPLAELWGLLRDRPNLSREDANAVETKFYGRLATPWECFVVVLVAIPFGAPSGRRNLFFGVAGSIFIGFAYFILQRFSLAFGMAGHMPGWLAAWLPNLLFAAAGIVLTFRVR
ncbi:MAG: LptF/LptG family permease [Verrucomicrobiota bacterium]